MPRRLESHAEPRSLSAPAAVAVIVATTALLAAIVLAARVLGL